jgi:hypothetical protein
MNDIAPLTRAETIALDDCEQRIERGLKTFFEVGAALIAIRDNRLYRASHGTFELYCRERWNMTPQHANRLALAAGVVASMEPIGSIPQPSTESQARELAKVPEADRTDVWAEAVERTGGKPTAKAVSDVVKERSGEAADAVRQADVTPEPEPTDDDERAELLAAIPGILAEGPLGLSAITYRCPGVPDRAAVTLALRGLEEAGRVEPAGRVLRGNHMEDAWALAELPDASPEDHPETGEGRSATDVAADKLPAPACEACGGEIGVEAEDGYLRCGACDSDGDHFERDGVCLGCNPPTDEDEPEPAREPMFSPEQRKQIEADAERGRTIAHARKIADRFLTEVAGLITEIELGAAYGERGLFTEDMAAGLRKQADRIENYLEVHA